MPRVYENKKEYIPILFKVANVYAILPKAVLRRMAVCKKLKKKTPILSIIYIFFTLSKRENEIKAHTK